MVKYILKRTGLIFLTLIVILTISFFLIKTIPIDPPFQQNENKEAFEIMMRKYGYDKPIIVQYFKWLWLIFTEFDWGYSSSLKFHPASELLFANMGTTMKINIISFFISIPLGFLFGIIAALKKNKLTDQVIMFVVMLFISIPSFVVLTFLILLFASKLQWLPIIWTHTDFPNYKSLRWVLPVAALSFGPIASLTRYTRAELTEVLTSEYLLLARTKGLTKRQTVLRHALRNSMIPLIGIVIGNFVGIIGGSLVIEQVYQVPGVGSVLLDSINNKDYNVFMLTLSFYTIINLFTILLIDISYGIIDPRIRIGGAK